MCYVCVSVYVGVDWDRMADRLLPGSLGGRKDAEKGKSSGLGTGWWPWAFLAQRYRFSSELITSRSLTRGLNYF